MAKPRRAGPPLSLTKEMVRQAAEIVGKGNFRYVARGVLGVPENTWNSWISRGKKEIRDYQAGKRKTLTLQAKLVQALDMEESRAHSQMVIDVLDSNNPRLKADFMYRRYGKLYSKNPNAIDDDTGEEYRVDPLEMLAEKLGQFIKEEEEK